MDSKDFEWINENDATELKDNYGDHLKIVVQNTATGDVEPLLEKSELTVAELKPHYKRLKHLLKIVDNFEIKSQQSIPNCKEILKSAQNKLNEIDVTKKAYKNLLEVINNGINNDIEKLQQGKMLDNKNCQIKQLENHLIGFIGTMQGESDKIYLKIGTPMSSLVTRCEKFKDNKEIAEVLVKVKIQALELIIKLDSYLSTKKLNLLKEKIKNLFDDAVNSLNENK